MPMTLEARREIDRARSRAWHQRRRQARVCANSPCKRVPDLNPRTGQPYWLCRACRKARRQQES